MPQVNITIPAPAVVEPTTSYSADIAVTATQGNTKAGVQFGSIQNDGNVSRTLRITTTGFTGCTLNYIEIRKPDGTYQNTTGSVAELAVPAGSTTDARANVSFTPPAPGAADGTASFTVTSQWV